MVTVYLKNGAEIQVVQGEHVGLQPGATPAAFSPIVIVDADKQPVAMFLCGEVAGYVIGAAPAAKPVTR
jgi:hypothetical protein